MKSVKLEDYMKDINKVFGVLRRYETKLNLEKYIFNVATRKFMGHGFL